MLRIHPRIPSGIHPFARQLAVLALGTSACCAQAATFEVLHTFDFGDGWNPNGAMVIDAAGVLYGTTEVGGPFNWGTLFKFENGTLTTLHFFDQTPDPGGAFPMGDLLMDPSGALYGTTAKEAGKFGTIFKYDAVGGYQVVHTFKGGAEGGNPAGGLARGRDGTLYGTTSSLNDDTCSAGKACGTVFRFDPVTLQLKTIHTFDGTDGAYPQATPTLFAGRLYTTTAGSFLGAGSPASMKANGKHFATFTTDGDADKFESGLAPDAAGNLWGVSGQGGRHHVGTVFRFDPATGTLTTLHDFEGDDGPRGGVTLDAQGTIYGTTVGTRNVNWGTIWRVVP